MSLTQEDFVERADQSIADHLRSADPAGGIKEAADCRECGKTERVGLDGPIVRRMIHNAARSPGKQRLANVRAVILLEGSVRPSPFSKAVGRSIIDLPISQVHQVWDLWARQTGALADMLFRNVPCRLMIGNSLLKPRQAGNDSIHLSVEQDPTPLRGTGGLLRDLAEQYDDEAYLIVANAAQILLEDLSQMTFEAAEAGGEVTIAANQDGSPYSAMLISCRALRELPPIGFVDLKEQGLPLIAKRHKVTVVRHNHAFGMPIRNHREYVAAIRAYDRLLAGESPFEGPFAERWESRFSIVEAGASIGSQCHLHDSVVLAGGIVEAGMSVIRSVVCAGGRASRQNQCVNSLFAGQL